MTITQHDPRGVKQLKVERLLVDADTDATDFENMFTGNIITGESKLFIHAEIAVSHDNNNNDSFFRLLFDSVEVADGRLSLDMTRNACTYAGDIQVADSVAAGAHAVAIEWRTPSGTVRCNADTNPEHHAKILMIEVVTP